MSKPLYVEFIVYLCMHERAVSGAQPLGYSDREAGMQTVLSNLPKKTTCSQFWVHKLNVDLIGLDVYVMCC